MKGSSKEEVITQFEQFVSSEERYFRYGKTLDNRPITIKINIIHSDAVIQKEKGVADLTFTFEFAQNLPVISEH